MTVGRQAALLVIVLVSVFGAWHVTKGGFWYLATYFNQLSGSKPPEMTSLCNRESGSRVLKTVENVEGYLDLSYASDTDMAKIVMGIVPDPVVQGDCFPCFEQLLQAGYSFVEGYHVDVTKTHGINYTGPDENNYAVETGLYRFTLVDRSTNFVKCNSFDRVVWEAKRLPVGVQSKFKWQYAQFKERLGDRCVYAEPIKRFTSKYQSRYIREIVTQPAWRGYFDKIGKSGHVLSDRGSGAVIASNIGFNYLVRYPNGSFGSIAACWHGALPPITEILRPERKMGGG